MGRLKHWQEERRTLLRIQPELIACKADRLETKCLDEARHILERGIFAAFCADTRIVVAQDVFEDVEVSTQAAKMPDTEGLICIF